ncbi:MAG: bifunctional fucokinase/fucose-1-phosphate guanylyltransferase [Acidimicrobiia bacterium]
MSVQRLISLPPAMVPHFQTAAPGGDRDRSSWFCTSDPPGKGLGSGGGTAHLLWEAFRESGTDQDFSNWLTEQQRLVIHSGGESRRLPSYAPIGKSLLPVPVFRWAKGQYLDQDLLDFQEAFCRRILKKAPASYGLLIGSGDTLFITRDAFGDLPEADILLFGVWVEEDVATRHGVFFSPRKQPADLAFVRQKPTMEELQGYAREYLYLMDSGIVLLSPKATLVLMERSGWDPADGFGDQPPGFYDLYGDMLTSFGAEASATDGTLADLTVKLHPIDHGEFYHFGSTRDLLDSCLRLQNRVVDQRLHSGTGTNHHPSVFLQNATVDQSFGKHHHHIWIENSVIPATWTLSNHHVLTGVPENDWSIELDPGVCINVAPMKDGRFALQVYGFDDQFKGSREDDAWLGQPVSVWLADRGLEAGEAGLEGAASMYDQPLFPLCTLDEIPGLLRVMTRAEGRGQSWLELPRISSRELAGAVDIPRILEQRHRLLLGSLTRLAANRSRSVFYHLDLEKAARDFREASLPLPPEPAVEEDFLTRINDHMFRARCASEEKESRRYEDRAFSLLREEMIKTLAAEPLEPARCLLDDQILWGRSPVRLDLAGGWTDTPPYCIMAGGTVVNLAVELNGQLPLQVYARPLAEPKVVLRSIDQGQMLEINSFEELQRYRQLGGTFSIPMAALVLAGFGPTFSRGHFRDLEEQLNEFGGGVEMSLLAAVPKGSGLGTSSNLAATVLGTLSEFCGLSWDRHQVAYRTLILEQMLTTGGGWQDQYGGIFEGVKLLETEAGIRQEPAIKWLPGQLFDRPEDRTRMLLYYTGVTRVARDILGEIVKSMFLNSAKHLAIFSEMKQHARDTFEVLLRNDYQGLSERVRHSWELNQRLDPGTNPPSIRAITRKIDDYALGYKLLGAGGGGYLLILAKSAEAAVRIKQTLVEEPPNAMARFVDFRVSDSGFQLSRS